jgi:hypothetical protein
MPSPISAGASSGMGAFRPWQDQHRISPAASSAEDTLSARRLAAFAAVD